MAPEGEKQRNSATSGQSPTLPSRTLPAVVMLAQGVFGGAGLLVCALRHPVQRFAVGTLASVLEVAFAIAILLTSVDSRKEAIRTFAVRYVMVVAIASLVASSMGVSSEVTGLHIAWSFALLGVLLGEPTKARVTLCTAALLLFDGMFLVGIARHAFRG